MESCGIVGGYFFGLFGLSTGNVENVVDKRCMSVYELLMSFARAANRRVPMVSSTLNAAMSTLPLPSTN